MKAHQKLNNKFSNEKFTQNKIYPIVCPTRITNDLDVINEFKVNFMQTYNRHKVHTEKQKMILRLFRSFKKLLLWLHIVAHAF